MVVITSSEKALLKHLRDDSRKSLAQISKEIDVPVSTLFNRMKALEGDVIVKHVSLLDYEKIGFSVKVNFAIKAEKKEQLKKYLSECLHVNTLSSLVDGYDFYAECIFKDMKEMGGFKDALQQFNITSLNEIFILDEIKREGFVI